MIPDPAEIGTLIVVILKARNLPNKRHLGKQAPYCTVKFNGETRRTKVIKRGGQHPEWDEEIRFTIYEDDSVGPRSGDGTPPPPPPKDGYDRKIRGGEAMVLSCFADDPREPDLIGETKVDLKEVLTKGETDEWFTLTHKDRYCGEVYLELTFWSNAPPPQKKQPSTSQQVNREYGGTGEFTPLADEPDDEIGNKPLYTDTIRPSNSSAMVNLYMPSYEPRAGSRSASMEQLVNDFGELGVRDHTRRSSTYPPPIDNDYVANTSSTMSLNGYQSEQNSGFGMGYSAGTTNSAHSQRSSRYSDASSLPFTPYQAPYEQIPSAGPVTSYPSSRRSRYSMPVSSSGFMPVPSQSEPTGFIRSSHSPEPNGLSAAPSRMSMGGFTPPVSHTPSPMRAPRPSHTPVPSSSFPILPAPSPAPSTLVPSTTTPSHLHQVQPYAPGLQVPFPQQPGYGTLPPTSAPPGKFPTPPQSTLPQIPHSAPPQQAFRGNSTPPHSLPSHVIPTHVPGSRPLPQPQGAPQLPAPPTSQIYVPGEGSQPLPLPPGPPGPLLPSSSFDLIPPPPSLPSTSNALVLAKSNAIPPPGRQRAVSHRPSLPLPPPPGPATQPSAFQALPSAIPPPPPLRRASSHLQLPGQPSQSSFAVGQPLQVGPPPRLPGHALVPSHGQWGPTSIEPAQYQRRGI